MIRDAIPAHVDPARVFEFDLYRDARLLKDVFAGYREIIEGAPAPFWTPMNGGHWVITRYDQCEAVCRDYEHFSATEMEIPRAKNPENFRLVPLHMDPPHATPFRQLLVPFFSPKAIKPLEKKIRAWAVRLIDEVDAQGRCEFIDAISSRFPVSVFMEMMGLPLERFDEFRKLTGEFFADTCSEERRDQVSQIVYGHLAELLEARMKNPADDMVSNLIGAEVDGRPIERDELLSMMFLLFLAGLDTVVNVMTFSQRQLAQMPEMQERLRTEPDLIPGFVEEALRLFGVVNLPRLVVKDIDIFGCRFRAGDMVLSLISQMGREAEQNPDPLQIDPMRKVRRLLTFSTGPHHCIGNHLARAEMRILFEEWLKRVPRFGLAPGFEPEYRAGQILALSKLPLVWDTAR